MVPGLPSLSCEISRGCSNKGLGGPITIIANGCRPPRPGETWDLIILFNRVSGGLGGLDERRSQEAFRILVRGRPQVLNMCVLATASLRSLRPMRPDFGERWLGSVSNFLLGF